MEFKKIQQRKFIALSIILLALLIAVGSAGYKAVTAHADGPFQYSGRFNVTLGTNDGNSYYVSYTANHAPSLEPCDKTGNTTANTTVGFADAYTNVYIHEYSSTDCSGTATQTLYEAVGDVGSTLTIKPDPRIALAGYEITVPHRVATSVSIEVFQSGTGEVYRCYKVTPHIPVPLGGAVKPYSSVDFAFYGSTDCTGTATHILEETLGNVGSTLTLTL
jgi:hypothetical protein